MPRRMHRNQAAFLIDSPPPALETEGASALVHPFPPGIRVPGRPPGSIMNAGSSMHTRQRLLLALGILGVAGGLMVGSATLAYLEVAPASRPLALVGGRILTQTDAGAVEGTVL